MPATSSTHLLRDTTTPRHSGIGLNTPTDVHYGLAAHKTAERSAVLATARTQNPERFNTTRDPKILALPTSAWINKPTENTTTDTTAKLAA